MATFELSSKKYKNGRRSFTAVLYELQPPECVVDGVGTKYNKNGITFLEEYAKKQLDSIANMSVRVAFIDDDRTLASDHGLTGYQEDLPIFKNATTIGHCTQGFIDDVDFNGTTKRCVCAKGYLDEMCYPDFIASLDEDLQNGIPVEGSIEIYKAEGNENIVYKNGWHDKGRIPVEYIHSGWDIVLNPADASSTLLELNAQKPYKKKEEKSMDCNMDAIKSVITSTMMEMNTEHEKHASEIKVLNDKIDGLKSQIEEKNSEIVAKDKTISELNASAAEMQKLLDKMKHDQETYWAERDILEKEIAKAKIAEKLAELDKTLSEFNDDEKSMAKDDIEKLKQNINACQKTEELNNVTSEINSIKAKICTAIVDKQKKAAKIAEQNSHIRSGVDDIFSDVYFQSSVSNNGDIDIFS